jgi:hypothetical protein
LQEDDVNILGILTITVASVAALMLQTPTAHAQDRTPALRPAFSAVLQTDGARAGELYAAALKADANPLEQRIARCGLARLRGKPSMPPPPRTGDALADRVADIYRSYWRAAMVPAQRPRAERQLLVALARTTGIQPSADADAILTRVSERLNARGFNTSQGKTAALYDLLLYLDEETKPFVVDLPDGTRHETTVYFMREFVSHGWAKHFTCGRTGTGGFAEKKGLYVVAEDYDLEGESFKVNFLAHETQHFSDYTRYPGLEGPELEYRAKLAELALADRVLRKTLDRFLNDRSDDRGNPHSHANKRVVQALTTSLALPTADALTQVDAEQLRHAARRLLVEDNAQRARVASP